MEEAISGCKRALTLRFSVHLRSMRLELPTTLALLHARHPGPVAFPKSVRSGWLIGRSSSPLGGGEPIQPLWSSEKHVNLLACDRKRSPGARCLGREGVGGARDGGHVRRCAHLGLPAAGIHGQHGQTADFAPREHQNYTFKVHSAQGFDWEVKSGELEVSPTPRRSSRCVPSSRLSKLTVWETGI